MATREPKVVHWDLEKTMKKTKELQRRKLWSKLQANNIQEVWCGMNLINGSRPKGSRGVESGVSEANELNRFFNRLDPAAPVQPPSVSAGYRANNHLLYSLESTAPPPAPPPLLSLCHPDGQKPPTHTFTHPPTSTSTLHSVYPPTSHWAACIIHRPPPP